MAPGIALVWHRRYVEITSFADGQVQLPVRWEVPGDRAWTEQVSSIQSEFPAWLRNRGWQGRPWYVAVPREESVVRWFELPAVDDGDLPQLVRFQASARASVPIEQLALDFIPLPRRPSSPGRDAIAATIPQSLVATFTSFAQSAGSDVAWVGLTSTGAAALVNELNRDSLDQSHCRLAVVRDGNRVDIVVTSHDRTLYAHAARIDATAPAQPVLVEISRCLLAAQKILEEQPLAEALLFDLTETPDWTADLAARIDLPVRNLRPAWESRVPLTVALAGGDEHRARGAIAWGLAQAVLRQPAALQNSWDFAHPRQPAPVRDIWKPRRAIGAAAALAVLALFGSWYARSLAAYDAELARVAEESNTFQNQITSAKSLMEAHAAVTNWKQRELNPVDQLAQLQAAMTDTSHLYLTQLDLAPASGQSLGRVLPAGHAVSRLAVQDVERRLNDSGRMRVGVGKVDSTERDPDYPLTFEIRTELVPAASRLPALPKKGS